MLQTILLLVAIYAIYFVFFKRNPLPICGVYSQPGKWFWLKYGLFRLIYLIRKRQNEKPKQENSHGTAGYGVKSKTNINQMETAQKLPIDHPKAVDAVYFNASNKLGFYLVAAIARRHQNVQQTVFILHIPKVGVLTLPTFPDTTIVTSESNDGYKAGGLNIEMITPMKKWKLTYKGDMILDDGKKVPVEMNAVWEKCTDYFDADTDMNGHALAVAIAREPWSRKFFDRLKSSHQTHYEQFGDIKGVVKVNGNEHDLSLRGARDHSYGNEREWKNFHRYALQFVHLENGFCFNVGVISMPTATLSRLEFGYLFDKDGRKFAVEWCDMDLPKLGESPIDPPNVFEFRFSAGDKVYHVECEVLHRPVFYLGREWEGKVYEQMCRYNVNGVKGYGFSEWEYRNLAGKKTA